MKKIVIILVLLLGFQSMKGQNAFYDGKTLRAIDGGKIIGSGKYRIPIKAEDLNNIKDLFVRYGLEVSSTDDGATTRQNLIDLFKNNPFIIIQGVGQSSDYNNYSITEPQTLSNEISVGQSSITKIADGLAKFLVERARQELTVAFFDRFKDVLDEYPEFATLFPNTKANFDLIESFNFSAYMKTLRVDFFKDLENLPLTLDDLERLKDTQCKEGKNETKCKSRIQAYKSFFQSDKGLIFKLCLELIQQLKQGSNPAEILSFISDNSNFTSLNSGNASDIKSAIFLAEIISSSLLSSDDDRIWVSGKEIKDAFKDRGTLTIYLGLLYQLDSEDKIIFNLKDGPKTLRKILSEISVVVKRIDQIEDYLKNVANEFDNVKSAIDNIEKIKDQNLDPSMTDYYTLYSGLTSLMSTSTNLSEIGITLPNQDKIDAFIGHLETAGGIYQDFASKNYSGAIMDLRIFITELGLDKNASPFLKEFFKYGTFMAAIVEAEDSDQVQAVIESIALPPGSAAIKRRSKLNVSLNGYLGFAYGDERNGSTDKKKNIFGMSAPVGIALSAGLGVNDEKGSGSLSLFVSLIDVGALTNFRFNDNETSQLPELKVENIFAPGAYVLYGFRRLPISIGGGYQYGPQLREINSTTTVFNNPSGSWRVMVAVDIPLLNFYTKSR